VLDALIGGLSLAGVADRFGISKSAVQAILKQETDRVYDGAEMRAEWMLTARRLRRMELAFDKKAVEQLDCAAAIVAIKASERRATLTGANAPIGHAVAVMTQSAEEPTSSTEKMLEAIRRLRGEEPETGASEA